MQTADSRGVLRLVVFVIACSSWCSVPHDALAAGVLPAMVTEAAPSAKEGLPPFVKKSLPADKVPRLTPHTEPAGGPRSSAGQSDASAQWLVFALRQDPPGHFVVTRLWLQSYDAKQKAFFDAVMAGAPPDVAGEYQLQLTQSQGGQQVVTATRFTHTTTTIYEQFAEDDSSGQAPITFLGEETEPAGRIVVKVPLLLINPDLPVEAVIQHLPTEQHQALPIPPELLKTLGDHAQKSGSPGSLPSIASLKRVFAPNLWMPEARAAPLDGVDLGSAGSGAQLLSVTTLNNIDDPGRLNIVVIGFDMQPEESRTLFQDIRNELLAREPVFQQNPAFANWWVLAKTYPAPNESCSTKEFQLPEEDLLTDNLMHTMFVYVFPNLACGNANARVAQQLAESMRIGIKKKWPLWPLKVFSHEFGHAFGGVWDEYEKADGPDKPKWPNCADTQEEAKQWWEALYPTMQLYAGCTFTPDNWRFFEDSIMRHAALSSIMFGNIHRWMLCEAVFVVTGATKGSYCTSLMGTAQGQYENSTAQCTDGVDNDTDGFVDCQDANCDGATICQAEETECEDWFDNNQNGTVDCQDPNCDGKSSCQFPKEVSCTDGLDNDGDQIKYAIGLLFPMPHEDGNLVKADKMETEAIEWQFQSGGIAEIYPFEVVAAQWCAKWHPDAPHARYMESQKGFGGKKTPKNCTQTSCTEGTYNDKLKAVFTMATWPDGSPNPYYQKGSPFSYVVILYECYGEAGVDCSDTDCVDAPACRFLNEPVCTKSETKCNVWKSPGGWESVDGDVTCFNGDDDEGDGAADCLDLECKNYDYSTQPSYFGSTSQCQGVHWKDRVLIKQQGPPDTVEELYGYKLDMGNSACAKKGMVCDHIEVKASYQPGGWFDVAVDKAFQQLQGSSGCQASTFTFLDELPEDVAKFAFRAVCIPKI